MCLTHRKGIICLMRYNASKQRTIKKIASTSLWIMAAAVLVLPGILPKRVGAVTTDELKARSSQLQAEIAANNRAAEELEGQARSLRTTIYGLDLQIDQTNKQIELITVKIAELEVELTKAQAELERQKGLLKASMRALYKKGGASTVELLVASDSFSQFMNDQEYLERLKVAIQDSTEKVIALKQQIQAQQAEQKELLSQQEAAKRSLEDTKNERANLLAQTEGEEARFRAIVDDLQKRRREVDEELTRRFLAGKYISLGRVETGQLIARVGMTGFTFGPHLHYEIRNGANEPVNPMAGGSLGYGMIWPVPSSNDISQYYGCGAPPNWYVRKCADGSSLHAGLDIGAATGSAIVATKSGTIIHRSDDGDGYGIKVIILHDDGMFTYYAHTSP